MSLGFREAFKAGISFGKDDMVVPETKEKIVGATTALAKEYEQQYNDGLITRGEKYNKVIDAWAKCSDKLAEEMMVRISTVQKDDQGRDKPINSIYMMSHSGARGSPTQMRQLAAMRGLMAKPSGEIIETPIISNFKEGLTVLEYFNSTHGARKGLADTALKTANSGYLTRRLVDVAQDSIITERDCGSTNGIRMRAILDAGQVVASLASRVLGRVGTADIVDLNGKVIVPVGTMIEEWHVEPITTAGIQEVKIRSVLTCEAKNGVCGQCYGRDLARGTPVNMGEAVGVIAAQSIGEPGTQLTMRTFHIGGAAQIADQSFIESNFAGTVRIRNRHLARNTDGDLMVMARNVAVVIVGADGVEHAVHRVLYGARLKVDEGDEVKRGQRIAEWDPYTRPIMSEVDGVVGFEDLVEGQSIAETADESTGITKRMVTDWRLNQRSANLKPSLLIKDASGKIAKLLRGGDARYSLPVESIIAVDPGGSVRAGDVIARISMEAAKTRDITGGLPRVAELFEARRPKDPATISEVDGIVRFGEIKRGKREIFVQPLRPDGQPDEAQQAQLYEVAAGKHLRVHEGDRVRAGDRLSEGPVNPHDILRIKGPRAVQEYLLNEVQEVYRLQGVKINDKHIGVIVRQMLQKVHVIEPGDTEWLEGENVDKGAFREANDRAKKKKQRPATSEPLLLGITKASLTTQSFISAASFQETTRVLTDAAIRGAKDNLLGLKENIIIGHLIPAGTGMYRYQEVDMDIEPPAMPVEATSFSADPLTSGLIGTPLSEGVASFAPLPEAE